MHDLSAAGLPADAPVVLAAHGITANGYWWLPLARELQRRGSRVRLLAPCLRGRGDSRSVGEPYGLAAHARDLVEVAARLGARPLLLGHSMGAFVAGLALADRPGAFAGALLVDGGVAVPTPVDAMAVARRVLRPLLARLDLR
ncbi:MAG: alpha/beta fold hydrolase, partial [Dermatophilaceae bacterium]